MVLDFILSASPAVCAGVMIFIGLKMDREKRYAEAERIRTERAAEYKAELQRIGERFARQDLMAELTAERKAQTVQMKVGGRQLTASEIKSAEAAARERREMRLKDKRGRKLTALQKKSLAAKDSRVNPALWLCVESNDSYFIVRHRNTGKVRAVAYVKEK